MTLTNSGDTVITNNKLISGEFVEAMLVQSTGSFCSTLYMRVCVLLATWHVQLSCSLQLNRFVSNDKRPMIL